LCAAELDRVFEAIDEIRWSGRRAIVT